MPVWHVSVSVRTLDNKALRNEPRVAEGEAVKLLRGVGGTREWWHWNRAVLVGHLRIGLTPDEYASLPAGCAIHDAGESGPERARRR